MKRKRGVGKRGAEEEVEEIAVETLWGFMHEEILTCYASVNVLYLAIAW